MSPRDPYHTKRDQLQPSHPFDLAVLRTVFEDQVLPGPKGLRSVGHMPTDEALEQFARILNHWHAYFYNVQETRRFNEVVKEATAAIEALQRKLPIIAGRHKAQSDLGDPFSMSHCQPRMTSGTGRGVAPISGAARSMWVTRGASRFISECTGRRLRDGVDIGER